MTVPVGATLVFLSSVLAYTASACGGTATPSDASGESGGAGGERGYVTYGGTDPIFSGPSVGSGGASCEPVNGSVQRTGLFDLNLVEHGANLAASPTTLGCEATYFPMGGGSLVEGEPPTGATAITCHGANGDVFYGFTIDILFTPDAEHSYPIGTVELVPNGEGSLQYDGEASVHYDEAPMCGDIEDARKQWTADAESGQFVVTSAKNDELEFSLEGLHLSPGDEQQNDLGKGELTLSGKGSAKLVEKE